METVAAFKDKEWRVTTIWECELKAIAQRSETLIQLAKKH